MAYDIINSRRMPYDIDGTEVGVPFGAGSLANWLLQNIGHWLSSASKGNLNNQGYADPYTWGYGWSTFNGHIFFFPEKREITHVYISSNHSHITAIWVYGSNNTANGVDGTWEQAALGTFTHNNADPFRWRNRITTVSFSQTYKTIKVVGQAGLTWSNKQSVHLYGSKAVVETPDDILFLYDTINEFAALKDWGDRPEGTVEYTSFRVKNSSSTLTANNINIQLNADEFILSFNEEGPWVTFVDISTLTPGQVSAPIYIRNLLGPPLLLLGPKAARIIANIGSWT